MEVYLAQSSGDWKVQEHGLGVWQKSSRYIKTWWAAFGGQTKQACQLDLPS